MPLRGSVSRRRSPRRSGTAPARSCSSSRTPATSTAAPAGASRCCSPGSAFAGLATFAPPLEIWIYLAAQAIALGVGHSLARIDAVRRRLLPEALVDASVAERARRAFAEHGLTRTQGQTGILVFIALLEHRVVVLADAGIHRHVGTNDVWQEVVDLAVAGLRKGRAVDGLDAALRRCGELLRRHVPAPDHNPNELPDRVVLED